MDMKKAIITKIIHASILLIMIVLLTGCRSSSPIMRYEIVNHSEQNQMVVGLFSIDDLSIKVTRKNGGVTEVQVTEIMMNPSDLAKFSMVGPQTILVKFNKQYLFYTFELFTDTLVSGLEPFYDYMKTKTPSLSSFSNWIKSYQKVSLPVSTELDLFYHNHTFYYRYTQDAEWEYLMVINDETFEVDTEFIYVGSKTNPKMVLSIDAFDHDLTNYLFEIYVEKYRHTGDFASFIQKWFTLSNFQQPVYRIDYVYDESLTTHGFGYDGEGIQSLPIHHKFSVEHLGWATNKQSSALFYGPITETIALYPVYQKLNNGISLYVVYEDWDELQMDIVLTGAISLNGLDLLLSFNSNHYEIVDTIYHLDGIHHETEDNLSFNYMNVQSRLHGEQAIITIAFKKLNPTHDLSQITLTVKEAIYINLYDRPEQADYLNTQWID
jgi:hypothetical protein